MRKSLFGSLILVAVFLSACNIPGLIEHRTNLDAWRAHDFQNYNYKIKLYTDSTDNSQFSIFEMGILDVQIRKQNEFKVIDDQGNMVFEGIFNPLDTGSLYRPDLVDMIFSSGDGVFFANIEALFLIIFFSHSSNQQDGMNDSIRVVYDSHYNHPKEIKILNKDSQTESPFIEIFDFEVL